MMATRRAKSGSSTNHPKICLPKVRQDPKICLPKVRQGCLPKGRQIGQNCLPKGRQSLAEICLPKGRRFIEVLTKAVTSVRKRRVRVLRLGRTQSVRL